MGTSSFATNLILRACASALALAVWQTAAAGEEKPEAKGDGAGAEPQYRLLPGDIVRFWVYRMPEFTSEAMVMPSGHITLPLAGQFMARGKTLEQLTSEVSEGLKERGKLVDPMVTLTVKELAKQRAYILGAVMKPQELVLPLDRPMTVSQAVATAGGFTPEAMKDMVRVYRQRRGSEPEMLTIDVEEALSRGAFGKDVSLMPGDTVFVPQEMGYFVLGKAARPGFYSRKDAPAPSGRPIMASEMIALAGGFAEGANASNVRVVRQGRGENKEKVLDVDLRTFAQRGTPDRDLALAPGDMIVIPSEEGVFVLGQVKKPGVYLRRSRTRCRSITLATV